LVNTLLIKKSPCKKKSEKIKLCKKHFVKKNDMLYKKQIELPEGREFGCLEFGPFQSFGKYEAIRCARSK